ncbi:MAG TPA: HlyD family efflux transporter periplasmic adaptor subunit [Saprospiraceae bacterium]|nr:HlyD family efflux transporter periplasmic adaptor subunit [Saprospiraceae bacterium]
MDRKITKKNNYGTWIGGSLILLLLFGFAFYAFRSGFHSTLQVDRDQLTISEVAHSPFYEYINLTGRVEPRNTYYIDSKVAGTVEKILVESGQSLRAGDTLLYLSNADLQLEVMQRETQLIEQLNNQRQTALLLNQNNFNQRAQLVEVDYQIGLQQKEYQRNKALLSDSIISQSDFEPIADRYDYLRKRRQLLQQSYATDSLARLMQLQQIDETEDRILNNLAAVRLILDRLYVTALAPGRLSDFTVQVGQALSSSDRLGEVYSLENPIIDADIDEFYLDKVSLGQEGVAFINGDTLPLRVEKIYPTVEEGRFQVAMGLVENSSQDLKLVKGQSFRIRLFFGEPTETTLLVSGNFYNATGGNWVYLVQGNQAVRRYIELGRKNPRYYEVLEGLTPGDRVITSAYDNFKDYETIKFDGYEN